MVLCISRSPCGAGAVVYLFSRLMQDPSRQDELTIRADRVLFSRTFALSVSLLCFSRATP